MARVEFHDDELTRLATSREMRRTLDELAFIVTAHAVPHSGVDTGRLVNSMDHRVEVVDGHAEAVLGSNASTGGDPVEYAAPHWADRADPAMAGRKSPELRGRAIPHPTKPAPTLPYSKALTELGIAFTVEPGGFES